MSTHGVEFDLGTLLDSIESPVDPAAPTAEVFGPRFLVATDWSSAAVPLAMLRAFRAIVPRTAPVRLVFAVTHQPSPEDAACVHVLLAGIGSDGDLSGLEIESFDEAASTPYDTAVVPDGDADSLVTQVVSTILRLQDVVTYHVSAGVGGSFPFNVGDRDALSERLSRFSP
ncbi:histidine kinase [Mobilicoccus caccae]|uniref:Uncharacterized protein n=1 Tax=Mobilicoccus caccae TaxID=1859295 RepID=A0ABQ6IWJ3_9MICO|nr:histidine kinase [Mobilicoccus caccae]GMA41069.1 hypothetical protein GCM10025883_31140 [Mobilicoccus caccae]